MYEMICSVVLTRLGPRLLTSNAIKDVSERVIAFSHWSYDINCAKISYQLIFNSESILDSILRE
jgi:hypothetical protein